jgi:hypothetical protein
MAPGQSSKPRKKWITSKFLYNSFKSNEAYISVLVFKDATGSTHTQGVRFEAVGYMVAPEPTSTGRWRCGMKL